MKKSSTIKYQIQEGNKFIDCHQANPTSSGWLEYTLKDGTVGLKRPGTWRVKQDKYSKQP